MNVNSIDTITSRSGRYYPGVDFELIRSYIGDDGARHIQARFPLCRFPNLQSIHQRFCGWRVNGPDSIDPDGRYFHGLRFISTLFFDDNLRCTVAEPAPRDDDEDSDASTEIDEWSLADVAAAELEQAAAD